MLLVVTVVSLLVAAVSATVAWRVTRADQQRRSARIAALSAAAGVSTRGAASVAAPLAAPPWSEVPSGLHEFMPVGDAEARGRGAGRVDDSAVAVGELFSEAAATSGSAGRQHWLMGAAAAVAGVVIVFAGIGFFGSRVVAQPERPPLELVALGHIRGDGGLAISGLVRNPTSGSRVQDLEADVRVFDAAGLLIGTRSARVEAPSLAPGQEATFAVTLGELATAARYRVSFRAAGAMLPHVDRRTNQPAAVTADAR
ncbi:MAG: FxLYD domain-containing protein [Acidobacteriota bacterium]